MTINARNEEPSRGSRASSQPGVSKNGDSGPNSTSYNAAKAELLQTVDELSRSPGDSIRAIVEKMVVDAFFNQHLFDHEFLEIFQEEHIADKIVDNFVNSMTASEQRSAPSSTETEAALGNSEERLLSARQQILLFLGNYDKSRFPTLFQKCEEIKAHLKIPFSKFFTSEIRAKLIFKINKACKKIATIKFGEIIKDTEGLYENYLFPSIFTVQPDGKLQVNGSRLSRALYFLEQHGGLNENTFFIRLYYWVNSHPFRSRVDGTREDVGSTQATEIQDDGYQNGNFDTFFKKNVAPEISGRRNKFGYGGPALHQIVDINFAAMARVIPPTDAVRPFDKFFSNEGSAEMIAHFFTLRPDENIEKLVPHLERAKKLVTWSFNEVMESVEEGTPARKEYKFIAEIMACNDLRKLAKWMVCPESFLDEITPERLEDLNAEYGRVNLFSIIAHETRKILELACVYRKCGLLRNVKMRHQDKKDLTAFLRERLLELHHFLSLRFSNWLNDEQKIQCDPQKECILLFLKNLVLQLLNKHF